MIKQKAEVFIRVLKEVLEKDKNVIFAYLFGSQVSGLATEKSDVDVAIYFKFPPRGMKKLDYAVRIENLVKKEIDLVVLNEASPFLRFHILRTGVPLVVKNSEILAKFKEKAMRDYDEYSYLSEAFLDR